MRAQLLLRLGIVLLIPILTTCSAPSPHKHAEGLDSLECGVVASTTDARCANRTPEVSMNPPYRLHFVEFDDQGWLYPDGEETKYAHQQIERAIGDIHQRLAAHERVLLLVFVHGWKHSAEYDDRDVMRFRQMLADAAFLNEQDRPAGGEKKHSVVGIYVGWRGAGRLSPKNPLVYLSFWTRKNAALHVSEGASRELFARIRTLRERANSGSPDRPPLRTVVIGHSFGAWIVYSALSPSIFELLASPLDRDSSFSLTETESAWHQARLTQAADMVVLVNPAFEASRYQPIHDVAQRLGRRLPRYKPPVLILVTSTADLATRQVFPVGRFFNTIFQVPFVSDEQASAARRTPGFMASYQTHLLTRRRDVQIGQCHNWKNALPGSESEPARLSRIRTNALAERQRHAAWSILLTRHHMVLSKGWTWQYCGGAFIKHQRGEPNAPVWNVVTDASLIKDHSDIMGEPLHAFLRQLYLDLPR